MEKTVSRCFGFALLLALMASSAHAIPGMRNLLSDPGFEEGFFEHVNSSDFDFPKMPALRPSAWGLTDSVYGIFPGDPSKGNRSLLVDGPLEWPSSTGFMQLVQLPRNCRQPSGAFSIRAKTFVQPGAAGKDGSFYIYIIYRSSNGGMVGFGSGYASPDGTWKKYSVMEHLHVNPGFQNVSFAQVMIQQGFDSAPLLFDDAALTVMCRAVAVPKRFSQ